MTTKDDNHDDPVVAVADNHRDEEQAIDDNNNNNNNNNVIPIVDLSLYDGDTVQEKADHIITAHPIVMISKTWCPFSRDAKDLLSKQLGVRALYSFEVNEHENGSVIFHHLSTKLNHFTVPMIFIHGTFIGGCDDMKALYHNGDLERKHLKGLIHRKRTMNTNTIETAQLLPIERSVATNPPLWFPNQVNNYVVRLVGVQVCLLSILSAATHWTVWGRYLAVGLLVDFGIRLCVGSSLSPLGMIATVLSSFITPPQFKPGPPKQFASFCGLMFSFLGTLFYFLTFQGHDIVGAIWMGMLAFAAGLEGFFDFCLGCLFFGWGIQFGIIPDSVYRIYTASRQEIVDGWNYKFGTADEKAAPVPTRVDTNPQSAVALKYQKKTDEWTKDDFDVIRHMQVSYFAMPLAMGGLATAFKMASGWYDDFAGVFATPLRTIIVPRAWSQVFSVMGAFFFVLFLCLYAARFILYPKKCHKEWDDPNRSSGFGLITITFTLYSFLVYDEINDPATATGTDDETNIQIFARVLWWVGAIPHAIITVMKFGEWIGRRLEIEHMQTTWMIFPVGLAVAALTAPIVGVFDIVGANPAETVTIARFFYSFAWLMWITLFVLTFFKTVTTHNSDDRLRHGVFVWIAAPCVLGLADYVICSSDGSFGSGQCNAFWVDKYFVGLFIFLGLLWASFPHLLFFGQAEFGMGYWIECFAIDTLAACASLFYALNGWQFSQTMQFIFLTLASIANMTAFLHTLSALIRKRDVFTPEVKWGPLSFMKLTHEAFRGNMDTLRHFIDAVDVEDDSDKGKEDLGLFAAHFNRFCIVHEEHAKHEDEVIFKTFNDFFPDHAKKWNDDHAEDHAKLVQWRRLANSTLDLSLSTQERKAALDELRSDLPDFFEHFEEHLRGEEDNLNPIGRKYLPINLMVQMSRKVWEITDAQNWEVIIPFIITGLPRHPMRIRYIKVLLWAMPERAQQIGAIIYRNVDAVMWERLRVVVPEMIPRGAPGWKRYY